MEFHRKNEIWDLDNLAAEQKMLPSKWAYKVKTRSDGLKYKAQ